MPHVTESRLRVRYAETDQMGIVYYANYFIWMEIGRTDFCRDCGFRYRDLEVEEKAFITVADARCRYIAPARYDDEILVETRIVRVRRRILEFAYDIKAAAGKVAEGTTLHVVTGHDGKPRALPDRYLELLQGKL
jgi:acyl-CoA thioester hydrolase